MEEEKKEREEEKEGELCEVGRRCTVEEQEDLGGEGGEV